jgi:hypothetical protein
LASQAIDSSLEASFLVVEASFLASFLLHITYLGGIDSAATIDSAHAFT